MLENREYCVGDLFKVYDKVLERDKFVVLSRFVLNSEHFVLLSVSTCERWTDRELAFKNEFEKTRLTRDEVLYLYGDDEITYVGNMSTIGREVCSFIDDKFSASVAV